MKWLLSIFFLFVILIGGLAVAPSFFDWNQYKEPALKQIADVTGHKIQIAGDVSLALLPSPRVYLENVLVKDPTDTKGERTLASFEQLDVRVGLFPLFKGKAVVKSISLDKPVVALRKNAQGQFNFMTPELLAMSAVKKAVSASSGEEKAGQAVEVSFESVSVSGGVFSLYEAGKKEPLELKSVELDIEAPSLKGPFKAKGGLSHNGRVIEFQAKTGKIDKALKSGSLNLKAQMDGMNLTYAGVVSVGDVPEVQGEFSLAVKSISDLMQKQSGEVPVGLAGALSIDGVLTANAEKASLKNASLNIGGKDLTGALEVTLKPLGVKGEFVGQDIIDLDQFKGQGKSSSAAFDLSALGGMLPKTLEIPVLGDVALSLTTPGVIANGQVLKDVRIKIQNAGKTFASEMTVGNIPGQGQLEITGALTFAEKSGSPKTGTEIYSGPAAVFQVKGQTQNLPLTVQAFSGLSGLPFVTGSKKGVFDIKGKLTPSGLSVDKGVVNIDEAAFSFAGALTGQKDTPRSLLKAKLTAGSVDLDAVMGGSGEPKVGDPLKPLKSFALPYDVDLDVSVNDAVLQGHDVKGVHIVASVLPNRLNLKKLSVDNLAGASVSASGVVADLKSLSGLKVDATIKTPDPYKLASAFKVDTKSWPKNLGQTTLGLKASGNLNALDVDASVKALGGQVGIQGKVADPLTQLKVNNLVLSVQHQNMNKAIQSFAKGSPSYASLAKPLDFKANVVIDGKVTSVSNIKANLAGASVVGALKFDASAAKPSLAGSLRVGDLVLKSGASGSSAGQKGGGGSSASSGKWSSASMDTGWLHSMNVNLDIAANSIVYETWNLSKPALKLTLQGGVLDIKDLKAGLYDGQISASGNISSSAKGQPMSIKMATDITNINIGSLAKALAGSGRIQGEGDVTLNFDVYGTGASQGALVSSLNGEAVLSGSNVVMKGFDLAGLAGALMESSKPLPRIQQIIGSSTSGGQTAFDTVKGAYNIKDGVVGISSMVMDGPEAMVVSTGAVSLPRWRIDTDHQITLKNAKDVEPFNVEIKGPLDNPGNTFGSGLFDTFIRGRLVEKLPGILGDDVTEKLQKFGILPKKRQQPAQDAGDPVSGAEQPANDNAAPAAPQQQDVKPEEALEGLLRGLLR